MAIWPFNKERPIETKPDPATRNLSSRTERLAAELDALGLETRAVAREAQHIRENNHFGAALVASMARRSPS